MDRDESTSIERQREIIEQWSSANGHRIVGWAEDKNVSGSVDPFDTKGLGPWLGDRAPEWDIVCVWKLDRLGRDAIKMNAVFGWCIDHSKTIVSATEGIDLSTPVGRLIANVIAFLAEGERAAISERVRGSRAKLRQIARWPGGKPPYGYEAVELDGGVGYKLVIDTQAKAVVKRIVRDLLDGSTQSGIARALTAEGVLTPADHYRAQRGLPVEEVRRWRTTPLRNLLRSPALLGQAHHDGQIVRDAEGVPVQLGEPLVSLDDWQQVQAILDGNAEARKDDRRSETSLLSGLATCAGCGRQLHHDLNVVKRPGKTYEYRYLRCADRCLPQMPAPDLEEMAEEAFLRELGEHEVRERFWMPGDDVQDKIDQATQAIDELSAMVGAMASEAARARLRGQLEAQDRILAELESMPAREAGWEWRSTGGTYAEAWNQADLKGRREMLARSGITFAARTIGGRGSKAREFHIHVPDELTHLT